MIMSFFLTHHALSLSALPDQIALEFVNQYWPMFYKEMLPGTRQVWEPVMIELVNKIFLRVPYRRLLPKEQQ